MPSLFSIQALPMNKTLGHRSSQPIAQININDRVCRYGEVASITTTYPRRGKCQFQGCLTDFDQ